LVDVWSASNHVKLIPAGTVARGVYRTGALQHGRSRMLCCGRSCARRSPAACKIPLTDTQATGPLGERIAGWIDSHFWERFGNALMLSTVQDVAAAASEAAPGKTAILTIPKTPRRRGGNGENDAGKQHQYPAHDVPESG
jgi:type IV secretion system protein VirB10